MVSVVRIDEEGSEGYEGEMKRGWGNALVDLIVQVVPLSRSEGAKHPSHVDKIERCLLEHPRLEHIVNSEYAVRRDPCIRRRIEINTLDDSYEASA